MAYSQRRSALRQEVRKGSTGTIEIWCVVDGESVAAYASGHTYVLQGEDGTSLLGPTSCSPTTVDGVSYFSLAIPAISILRENCRAIVSWLDSGQTARRSQVFFDVVTTPWSETPRPTLNDLQAARPDCIRELDRLGALLGYASGDEAQAEAAASITYQARVALDHMLRAKAAAESQIRPALILDQDRLFPVEVALSLSLLYESLAENPNATDDGAGDSEVDSLARFYRKKADDLMKGLRVVYDLDQDQAGSGPAEAPAIGAIRIERVQ
jgi:hypothetical protein